MSDVQAITIETTQQAVTVSPVAAPAETSGISQAQADARYVRKPAAEGDAGDVLTETASGPAWNAPSIPWASTNW